VGDRVTATGTVAGVSASRRYTVRFDGDGMYRNGLAPDALTLIEPAEPPVGSVVVKDGVAWVRNSGDYWVNNAVDQTRAWPLIGDGEVIFIPGGDA
jgi:hypothetical protein